MSRQPSASAVPEPLPRNVPSSSPGQRCLSSPLPRVSLQVENEAGARVVCFVRRLCSLSPIPGPVHWESCSHTINCICCCTDRLPWNTGLFILYAEKHKCLH